MSSPLLIARSYATQASESKKPPVISNSKEFSFTCSYPDNITKALPFSYQVKVEWDAKSEALYINSRPARLRLRSWDNAHPFFESLDNYARMFLDSENILPEDYDEEESDYTRPNATLYAKQDADRINPQCEAMVMYEDDDSFGLNFMASLQYSCHALHLCRPVFFFIASAGHEPSLEQVFKLLTMRHAEGQVLRDDAEFSREMPPRIFFPEGLFGGKISVLRPQ